MNIQQLIMELNELTVDAAGSGCKSQAEFEQRKRFVVECILIYYSGLYGSILGCPPPTLGSEKAILDGIKKLIIEKMSDGRGYEPSKN